MKVGITVDADVMVGKPFFSKKIGDVYVNFHPVLSELEVRPELGLQAQVMAANALLQLQELQSRNESRTVPAADMLYTDYRVKILVNGSIIGSAYVAKMGQKDDAVVNVRRDLLEGLRRLAETRPTTPPIPGGTS